MVPADGKVTVVAGDDPADLALVTITNTFIPPVCETAWAAHDIGVYPYNPGRGGNWATYVAYDGEAMTVPLLAGQYYLAGWVHFSAPSGGNVGISINLLDGVMFEEGKTNIHIQDYENAPKGNPAPGSFAHKYTASGSSHNSISVPVNNFYGVHVLVCGWDMEIYTGSGGSEIAAVASASGNELVELDEDEPGGETDNEADEADEATKSTKMPMTPTIPTMKLMVTTPIHPTVMTR
jgi:hypothetical protein